MTYFYMEKIKCIICNEPKLKESFIKSNKKLYSKCSDCRDKEKQKYENFKKNNLCPTCRLPNQTDQKCCSQCREKFRIKAQRRREAAKQNGLCICCYKRKPNKELTSCIVCLNSRKSVSILNKMFIRAKRRAKTKDIDFSITKEDIVIPTVCPILGLKLQENKDYCKYNSYSLDRINPTKGYVKGNVQVISQRANQLKNDATASELRLILKFLDSQEII